MDWNTKYYARQLLLPEVGFQGQEKLLKSKCLVVGAGGLGSSALYYLASAGIGRLGICDGDTVDMSNLHRQVLYTVDDVGVFKAEAAATKLRRLNPSIQIEPYCKRLNQFNCAKILTHYDLVLDCTDNFHAKFLLNDASVLFNIPLIRASIYRFEGQLNCYLPKRNEACLRCLWPDIPQDGCVGNCADVGVLGPLPGFFGVLQAMEAIKFFLGLPLLAANAMLMYDLISHTQKIITLSQNSDCPLCGKTPTITELSGVNAWEIDAYSPSDFQLVDIREKEELEQDSLVSHTALHLPLSAFDEKFLDRHQSYLFFCARGRRSYNLVSQLRAQGWNNIYSLIGGINTIRDQ